MKVTINENGSKDDGDLVQGMKQKGGRVTRLEVEKQFRHWIVATWR